MQPTAVRIIREEHTAIACVIHSLEYVAQRLEEGGKPNFRLLHAMLEFIDEYPEKCHHPKENRYLFKILRERSPSAGRLLDELETEHTRGDELLKDLRRALERYELEGRSALAAFNQLVTRFAEFHWQHITKEEDVLMPIARKVLTDADWREISEAFLKNDNPLAGLNPKEHYAQLFDRILHLATKSATPLADSKPTTSDT
jgi:hemerythrin-like domain-containing protein